jgi:hypothetical protein
MKQHDGNIRVVFLSFSLSFLVDEVRVLLVVVIGHAPYPFLSLQNRAKESKPPKVVVVVCKQPFSILCTFEHILLEQ